MENGGLRGIHTSETGQVAYAWRTLQNEKLHKLEAYSLPFNLLNPTGHVTHKQFNIQQLYVLPTLYLCVLYLSENKQRLVPLTA